MPRATQTASLICHHPAMAPISGEKRVLTSILKAAYHQAPILYFIFYPDTPLALFPWATIPFLLFPQNAPVSGPWNWLFPQPGTPPFGQYLLCSFLHFLESLLKCHRGCEAFPPTLFVPPRTQALFILLLCLHSLHLTCYFY